MPMNYYYGFDYTWYLLVLPAFLLALWAQLRVKTTYAKYSKIRSAGDAPPPRSPARSSMTTGLPMSGSIRSRAN